MGYGKEKGVRYGTPNNLNETKNSPTTTTTNNKNLLSPIVNLKLECFVVKLDMLCSKCSL